MLPVLTAGAALVADSLNYSVNFLVFFIDYTKIDKLTQRKTC